MTTEMEQEKPRILSYAVFGATLIVVVINLVSLLFPALLFSTISEIESEINPFEIGAWAVPFLAVNLFLLGFGVLYYKKKMPNIIKKIIDSILKFEVSRRSSTIIVIILLFSYIVYAAPDLRIYEATQWEDFQRIEKIVKEYPTGEIKGVGNLAAYHVTNSLLKISDSVLQNIKIIPFIASICLLLLTYFFTAEVSQKRFAGIVAVIIMLQSFTFHRYDTLATYPNFWILFYLLSLYLILKKPYLSSISYFLSIFSKALTAQFLPMSLFFIYNEKVPIKKKIYNMIPYIVAIVIVGVVMLSGVNLAATNVGEYSNYDFIRGFTTLAYQLRADWLVLIFLLPLTFALFLKSRKGLRVADSILILILGGALSAPLLAGFTGFNIFPYRFMPLVVFFAVGVGTLLSKKVN
jgi:hypothetical protein